jgi:hypothetical protein
LRYGLRNVEKPARKVNQVDQKGVVSRTACCL